MLAKVLVVDDQEDFRSIITMVLRSDPSIGTIVEAEDGLAALDLVRREQPHLVVIDVMMPWLDGLEATRRIKRSWPSTKVIVASSVADAVFQRAANLSGADAFLDKRDIATALLPLVRRLIPAGSDGCHRRSD